RISRAFSGEQEPSYPLVTRSKSLPQPTDDGAVIRRVAIALWDAAAIDEPVRLLGVTVSNLTQAGAAQLELFVEDRTIRGGQLGPALDAIRERFGEQAIRVGAAAPPKLTPSQHKKRGR
ncbi:MAG: hypothetical protein ACHQ53_14995, partial [Polyangiales bacterium]